MLARLERGRRRYQRALLRNPARYLPMDDCIIVGGGPAGLTAAIYLARFHLSVRLFDCGTGRAAMIPRSHNHAGFPGGISGSELLDRMREQAARYGTQTEHHRVTGISGQDGHFTVDTDSATHQARTVLAATGVVNHRPDGLDDALHDEALERGLLRYCPICDAYEVTDKRVGVIGTSDHGADEALFLRGYTSEVTLISPHGDHDLDADCIAELDAGGITRIAGPCGRFAIEDEQLFFDTAAARVGFDSVYPALGSAIRSELAVGLGAATSEEGCIKVDDHQRTNIAGLYAAGDVVIGLDQISHAMGAAGIAATAIRNHLAQQRPLRR